MNCFPFPFLPDSIEFQIPNSKIQIPNSKAQTLRGLKQGLKEGLKEGLKQNTV